MCVDLGSRVSPTCSEPGSTVLRTSFRLCKWGLLVCWLVACSTSQQRPRVSQGRICSDNFYVLPHWDRCCRSNFLPHPVTVSWHRVQITVQHTVRLSRGTKGQLSYQVWQGWNRIYFSFILLAEPLTDKGGEETGVPGENPWRRASERPTY